MLIPGSRPGPERAARRANDGHVPVPAAHRILRRIAPALAAASAIALPLAAAGPASADQARQRQQWVLTALDLSTAWRVTQGRGVTVAVIDSGVDRSVSDLTGSVTTGPDYTDVHTPASNPNWGTHGTWMASLIASHGHGPRHKDGILGVAPRSRILSIRVITDQSDPGHARYEAEPVWRGQHELAKAIRYAVNRHVGVISMSLGYDAASLAVRAALQYALIHNVVVVASSGNSGTSQAAQGHVAPYSFPADYPGVIGVAAVSQSGQPAYFSSENLSVQVAAPGVDVPAQGRGSKYWIVSGTSPACALTAGVAALVKSRYPKLTAAQVRSAITLSTAHRPQGGYDDHVGFGTVDAAAALRAAGRLARQVPGGNTSAGKAAASGNFGRGPAGAPAFPVSAPGRQKLFVLLGASAACLLLVIAALWRLVVGVRRRKAGRSAGSRRVRRAGQGGVTGSGGSAAAVRYPTQIFPAQPYRQGRPVSGFVGQPSPGYPVPGYLGQPGQPGPGQAGPGQAGPGQGPPWPDAPGQYPPAPGYPGQFPAGSGYATQGAPGTGYVDKLPPSLGYSGQVPSWPDQTASAPGHPAAPGADYLGQLPAGSVPSGPVPPGPVPPGPVPPGPVPPGSAQAGPAAAFPEQAYQSPAGTSQPTVGYPGFPSLATPLNDPVPGDSGRGHPGRPSWPTSEVAGLPTPSGAMPPAFEPPAASQPVQRDDDEWWFDQDDRADAQPGRTAPPEPDDSRQPAGPPDPGWTGTGQPGPGPRSPVRTGDGLPGPDSITAPHASPAALRGEPAPTSLTTPPARQEWPARPASPAEPARPDQSMSLARPGSPAQPGLPVGPDKPAQSQQPARSEAIARPDAPAQVEAVAETQQPAHGQQPAQVDAPAQAQAQAAGRTEAPAQAQAPTHTEAPGQADQPSPVGREPATRSWAFERSPDLSGSTNVIRRPPESPGYRSVWEPLGQDTGGSARPLAAEQPSQQPEPPVTPAPAWQQGLSKPPATIRRADGAGQSPKAGPVGEPGAVPTELPSPPRYLRSTGISRQPGDGRAPEQTGPAGALRGQAAVAESQPADQPAGRQPASGSQPGSAWRSASGSLPGSAWPSASGSLPGSAWPSASGSLPAADSPPAPGSQPASGSQPAPGSPPASGSQPASGPRSPSGSQPVSGAQPLPRRQPQTHLAAPLRRPRPPQGPRQQADRSQPLPSVWEVRRPAATTEQTASPPGPDPSDDQA